jgi:uncharacterized membrane protein YtjA (UPF0391 family)
MEVLGLVILSFLIVLVAAMFGFFGITPTLAWIAWIVLAVFVVLFLADLVAQLRPQALTLTTALVYLFQVGGNVMLGKHYPIIHRGTTSLRLWALLAGVGVGLKPASKEMALQSSP